MLPLGGAVAVRRLRGCGGCEGGGAPPRRRGYGGGLSPVGGYKGAMVASGDRPSPTEAAAETLSPFEKKNNRKTIPPLTREHLGPPAVPATRRSCTVALRAPWPRSAGPAPLRAARRPGLRLVSPQKKSAPPGALPFFSLTCSPGRPPPWGTAACKRAARPRW